MTKDCETRLRREFEARSPRVSEEGAMCVLNAIGQCSATCAGARHINDVASWLIKRGALSLLDELKEAVE